MQTVSYMGDGTTTEFIFNFPYYENSNVIVTINESAATGYSIVGTSGGADADIPYVGGKVVFETAPTAVDNITISRQLPTTRTVDYQPTAKIDPTTLNQDMNYAMQVLQDFEDKLANFQTRYDEITSNPSVQTFLERIEHVDQLIAGGQIVSKAQLYSYITSCVLEIPRDIKLELNNGALILKATSAVHLANGDLNDTAMVASDITATASGSGQYMVIRNAANSLFFAAIGGCLSGTIANRPSSLTSNSGLYFATDENKIYLTGNSGATWYSGAAFTMPLAIVTISNGTITAIDQVFNGFGYIGSTIFALPGVKGLIPNGRNADGTLNNTEFTTNAVLVQTLTGGNFSDRPIVLNATNFAFSANATYDQVENKLSIGSYMLVGKGSATNGVIGSFSCNKVCVIND